MQIVEGRLTKRHTGFPGLSLMGARVRGRGMRRRLVTPTAVLSIHPAGGRKKAILLNGTEVARVPSGAEAKRTIWAIGRAIERASAVWAS